MSIPRRLAASLVATTLVLGSTGCSKLKSALHHDADGGADAGATASPGDNPLAVLGGFEGEIGVLAKEGPSGKAPINVTLFVKGDKLRVDVPEEMAQRAPLGGKGYGIYNVPEKKVYFVSDAQKQVIVFDLSKGLDRIKGMAPPHGAHPGGAPEPGPHTAPPKVTKTGKKDMVAGYPCEEWDIASDHREGSMCIAQQGVSWFQLPTAGVPTEYAWAAEVFDGKHFPLRFIGYEKDGAESGRIEVSKLEKKTLQASLFEIPAGYKVVDLDQMLGQLPGLPHGGLPMPPPSPKGHAPNAAH